MNSMITLGSRRNFGFGFGVWFNRMCGSGWILTIALGPATVYVKNGDW